MTKQPSFYSLIAFCTIQNVLNFILVFKEFGLMAATLYALVTFLTVYVLLWLIGENDFSFLGLLNFVVLQWFFVRVNKLQSHPKNGEGKVIAWSLSGFILPLTGWWSLDKIVGKPWAFYSDLIYERNTKNKI